MNTTFNEIAKIRAYLNVTLAIDPRFQHFKAIVLINISRSVFQ